ncbi:SDR family NAD(P)-dependent oxidoreductase [Burkholderia multivorans]|uniref:SDR family NAD(P)-dependent oxidoreductase n=1 Tax=Burkholderia multivorans TaxID=87883 RepID=UPI000F51420C|nr:SDR family oxidoreductase [Burkholderia multivorans]AYY55325.1 SDR family oxidoreductase [Burkholderia multivorans]MCA8439070.1 SDR family oxidoreductase [Burkholderia multivorans]
MSNRNSHVVIITGAAQGIGYGYAERLVNDGNTVVIFDINGATEAAERLNSVSEGRAIGYNGDVTIADDWDAMLADLKYRGLTVQALVNNAALFASIEMQSFDAVSRDEWARVMEINTWGPFLAVQKVAPLLKATGGGVIVNMASTAPLKGVLGMPHYVASKGAVIALTRSLARELGEYDIRVNAIAPGFTLSDGVMKNREHVEKFREIGKNARALKRDSTPSDLAGALAFLLSADAAFITGQTLVVDGGAYFV